MAGPGAPSPATTALAAPVVAARLVHLRSPFTGGAAALPLFGLVIWLAWQFVPLGAPVFVDLDRNEADGLWVAQDTGGAIKGANRFDTFWGAGDYAERIAGGMSANGTALILLPKGSVARIRAASARTIR